MEEQNLVRGWRPKMEPELKKRWVRALRSGEYKQATGTLYSSETSEEKVPACCCLGVLEHICGTSLEQMSEQGKIVFPKNLGSPKSPEMFWKYDLPETRDSISDVLANMNDGNKHLRVRQRSFEEIADWIEQNL